VVWQGLNRNLWGRLANKFAPAESTTLCNRLCRAAAVEYAIAQECPLQRTNAADPTAPEARRLAGRVQPGHRLARRVEHPRLQVGEHAAHALAADDALADGDQRAGLGVEDWLVPAGAQAVAAPLAQLGQAAQLVVVVQRRAALEHGVVGLHI